MNFNNLSVSVLYFIFKTVSIKRGQVGDNLKEEHRNAKCNIPEILKTD